jgi:acyl dehydratase/NADP-dependent 3-hydroxy acid dehydrogenase YdfG
VEHTGEILATRKFGDEDQVVFAEFSGDVNPIHMDEIEARKLISGRRVVHGMHGLLWALDCLVRYKEIEPNNFKCQFIKPIFLGEQISCIWIQDKSELVLSVTGLVCTKLRVVSSQQVGPVNGDVEAVESKKKASAPDVSDFVKGRAMPALIYGDPTLDLKICPSLSSVLGNQVVCRLASISTFVGMELPGLHSMLSSVRVEIAAQTDCTSTWTIEEYDKRFNRLQMTLQSPCLTGRVDAFHFPRCQEGSATLALRQLGLKKKEFSHVNALVIGGSRGLGNAVARMLCAGGARVTVTYNQGKADAKRLQEDMTASGMNVDMVEFKVDGDVFDMPNTRGFNQVYYFASPKIFERKSSNFDVDQYSKFYKFYVTCFERLCRHIIRENDVVSVFYPSSVAVAEAVPGMEEYAKAKLKGEALCRELNSTAALNVRIYCPRLPRLDTDQTVSIVPVKNNDPYQCLIEHLRGLST